MVAWPYSYAADDRHVEEAKWVADQTKLGLLASFEVRSTNETFTTAGTSRFRDHHVRNYNDVITLVRLTRVWDVSLFHMKHW